MTHSMAQQKRTERLKRARFAQGQSADRDAAALQFATPLAGLAHDLNRTSRAQANQSLQAKLNGTPSAVAQANRSQALAGQAAKRMADSGASALSNRTGLPDRLKAGVEQLSGASLDGARVHYDSARPAQLQALAFTQGHDIHVGPGQERHLPHEAWHAAQQLQGRVAPTTQLKGVALNNDAGLGHEADIMGARALQTPLTSKPLPVANAGMPATGAPVQRYFDADPPSDIDAVAEYVHEARPDLLEAFYQIVASDEPTDLYDWLDDQLHVTMHGVYDWQNGIVRGQPLYLDEEEVRGAKDIPEDSDEELEEFHVGLDEADYTTEELEQLHHQLGIRGAPHDANRRTILREYANLLGRKRQREDLDEEEEFEAPNFSDSEDDGSGTDTDGSDTEDDESYVNSMSRPEATELRLEREAPLLKPHLVLGRLTKLGKAMALEDPAEDSDEEMDGTEKAR